MNTFERVKMILVNDFSIDAQNITPTATASSLGIDSLDFIEVLWRFEEEFQVHIDTDVANQQNMETIGDIITTLNDLITAQNHADGKSEAAIS